MANRFKSGVFLTRLWRLALAIALYAGFGAGALLVSLLVIPLIAAFSWNRARRIRRVRAVNHRAFNLFVRMGCAIGFFDVSVINADRLRRPGQLIFANHPSLLDVVILIGHIPQTNCVVKERLLRNPFLAAPVYFAGYIRNTGNEDMLRACLDNFARGESLIIFPEGTRSSAGQEYDFKRGAAHLMLMSNCPVRPVYISCEPSALKKEDRWYITPMRRISYRLTVIEELDMKAIRAAGHLRPARKARLLTKWLQAWYRQMDTSGPASPEAIALPTAPEPGG